MASDVSALFAMRFLTTHANKSYTLDLWYNSHISIGCSSLKQDKLFITNTWSPIQGCRWSWWRRWPLARRKQKRRRRNWRSCHSWGGKRGALIIHLFRSWSAFVCLSFRPNPKQTWRLCTPAGTSRRRSTEWRGGPRGWRGPGPPHWTLGRCRTWRGRRSGSGAACRCWLKQERWGRVKEVGGRPGGDGETVSASAILAARCQCLRRR